MKKNILVIFGGKSVEHDISVITGNCMLRNIDKEAYNIIPLYIKRNGVAVTAGNLFDIEIYKNFEKNAKKQREISFLIGKQYICEGRKRLTKVDVAILCTHGCGGEDGSLAGVLELAGIPYTSSAVTSSAVGMDKVIMKDVFFANGIPSVDYVRVSRHEFESDRERVLNKILNKLNFPIIVKPSSLGSSIGISCSNNRGELSDAIEIACMYDDKILIEKFLEDVVEINCACIGTFSSAVASNIEVPKRGDRIFSFEEKYLTVKEKLNNGVSEELEKEIKNLALDVYKTCYCSGVVRIDFLYDNKSKILYVNEINTIPGSLAFYLFAPNTFSSIIEELIDCAIKKHEDKKRNTSIYESAAIDIFSKLNNVSKYTK